jgi:hypothetical protein
MVSPPLPIRLLRVNKAHRVLHGIKEGSLDDNGHFPPDIEYVFGQSCHT